MKTIAGAVALVIIYLALYLGLVLGFIYLAVKVVQAAL